MLVTKSAIRPGSNFNRQGGSIFHQRQHETSIWYFWGMARDFKPEDAELTAKIREGQGKIFGEDLDMLEQQQNNLLAYPDRPLLKLNIDAGGVQSRRILERIIAREQAAQAEAVIARSTS
ncbi:hypothetical protein [Pseudomonas sp. GWSMS-1]|uniref:hypothetical protein n=1 Tax=Pseudomonas sp. GWSMS-1 TaxID=3308997 RepID=UPI003CF1D18A